MSLPPSVPPPPFAGAPGHAPAAWSARLLEVSPLVVGVFADSDGRAQFLNAKAQQVFIPGSRETPGDLSLALGDIIGPSSQDRFRNEILPRLRVLGVWRGRCELLDAWGAELEVVAVFTALSDAHGAPCLAVQAIEAKTLAGDSGTAARATDQDLLAALLDHVPDHIYFKDISSRFLRVSRAQARRHGKDPREMIGRTDFDTFSADHASQAFADEQLILRTGQPIVGKEEKETWPDGRITWVSTTKAPLYDAQGTIVGTFGVSRDTTARHRAEEERQRAAEERGELEQQLQLAHKLESTGRLAAGVAQEIRTPTQLVADHTRFLQTSFQELERVLAAHETLLQAARELPALAGLVQELDAAREAAKLGHLRREVPRALGQSLAGLDRVATIVHALQEFAHPHSPECIPADINRAIESTLTLARHEWKGVADVLTELDPALPPVPCVLDQFHQVILNLIVNAAHAIGEALKQTGATKGTITVRTRLDGGQALIEIADSGTGIPPEIRDRIFELFFTTKPEGQGAGQGLARVRRIVRQHHGSIDFTSAVGLGTTFRLRLPLAVPAAAVAATPDVAAPAAAI